MSSAEPTKPIESTKKTALAPTVAVVFAAALLVRLIYFLQVRHCPLFQVPTIDAGVYYDLAKEFAHGHWLKPLGEPYWQPPFYPFILALWIKAAGTSVYAMKIAQLTLGSVNCALVTVLGAQLFNKRIGLIAGLIMAMYGPIIYFDGELLTPTLQIFFNSCALLILLRAVDKKSIMLFCAAGLALGLSTVTRPDGAVFVLASVIWLIINLRKNMPVKQIMAICLAMVSCAALPVIPITIRNAVVGKDTVLISTNGGLNFYIGNNPDEEKTREIRPGPDWDALQAMPMQENPHAKPSAQSAYFYNKALKYAVDNPIAYIKLLFKKSVMFFTSIEGRRNHDLYFYRGYSPLYSALMFRWGSFAFPFGLLFPLAVFGLLRRKPEHNISLLCFFLAAQFISVIAFFVCARYRITAIPVLIIFASYGAVEAWNMLKNRQGRNAVCAILLAVCALVVSNVNIYGVDRNLEHIDADTQFYMGSILGARGDFIGAYTGYMKSIAGNPHYEVSRFDFSELLMKLGDNAEAKRQLKECLRIDPGSPAANARLGEIFELEGNLTQAERHFEAAARSDSVFIPLLVALSEKAYGKKNYALSAKAMSTVVKIKPKYAEARRSLGVALMKLGNLRESIEQLQEACKLAPNSTDSLLALGLAYYNIGDKTRADINFAKAIRIGPENEVRRKMELYLRNARAGNAILNRSDRGIKQLPRI